MDRRTDDELVAACRSGDRDAYVGLLERHQDALFNLAYRMTGSTAEADDVAQESFIRAYQRLGQYRSGGSFRNWAMGICANVARTRFRSRVRREEAERQHAELADLETDGRDAGLREALDQALMAMPETTRVPIVLKYMEGLSLEDIARALRIGMSAVKMRLLRGREELTARLQRRGMGVTS